MVLVVLVLILLTYMWWKESQWINTLPSEEMTNRDFALWLKREYERHKHDPNAFVRAVPRLPNVDQNAPIAEQIKQCGFVNGQHDLKRSMYASYLARYIYGRSWKDMHGFFPKLILRFMGNIASKDDDAR